MFSGLLRALHGEREGESERESKREGGGKKRGIIEFAVDSILGAFFQVYNKALITRKTAGNS